MSEITGGHGGVARARARGWTTRTTSRCSPTPTCASGDVDAGLAAVAEALELARRERSLFYEPELLPARRRAARGRAATLERAEASLRRGLERAREQGSATLELRIATDLARLVARPRGRRRGARRRRRRRYAAFDEGFGTRDLREAAALLEARVGA